MVEDDAGEGFVENRNVEGRSSDLGSAQGRSGADNNLSGGLEVVLPDIVHHGVVDGRGAEDAYSGSNRRSDSVARNTGECVRLDDASGYGGCGRYHGGTGADLIFPDQFAGL